MSFYKIRTMTNVMIFDNYVNNYHDFVKYLINYCQREKLGWDLKKLTKKNTKLNLNLKKIVE